MKMSPFLLDRNVPERQFGHSLYRIVSSTAEPVKASLRHAANTAAWTEPTALRENQPAEKREWLNSVWTDIGDASIEVSVGTFLAKARESI